MGYAALLIGIGLVGGFVAGLLGLGGSVLMVPLLLGIPPALGYAPLTMRATAAISLVHVAFAAGAALLVRADGLHRRPLRWMGAAGGAAALAGGLLSARATSGALLLLFAATATVATVLLLIPRREVPAQPVERAGGAVLIAGLTGLVTGLVGAAGGFLLVLFIQYVLRLPAPMAQGSALRIVLISALAGLAGKLATGQVPPALAAALVLGALPGTWWGGEVSARLDPRRLRWAALAAAAVATVWVWGEALPQLSRRIQPGHLYLAALAAGFGVPILIFARTYRAARATGPCLRPAGRGEGEPDESGG
ncbi:MAG: TSUP family transporter [Bacillota bacterium]